jgi:hypothetical protein
VTSGSALCLSCGLCCRGVLHDEALLDPVEVGHARTLGLDVEATADRIVFRLPCPRLEGARCDAYGDRPRVCGAFRCRVLRDMEAGRRSLEDSLRLVTRARRMADRLEEDLPGRGEGRSVWRRLAESRRSDTPAPPEIQADAARLLVWTAKYFKGEPVPTSRMAGGGG